MERDVMRTANTLRHACTRCLYVTQRQLCQKNVRATRSVCTSSPLMLLFRSLKNRSWLQSSHFHRGCSCTSVASLFLVHTGSSTKMTVCFDVDLLSSMGSCFCGGSAFLVWVTVLPAVVIFHCFVFVLFAFSMCLLLLNVPDVCVSTSVGVAALTWLCTSVATTPRISEY